MKKNRLWHNQESQSVTEESLGGLASKADQLGQQLRVLLTGRYPSLNEASEPVICPECEREYSPGTLRCDTCDPNTDS